MMHVVFLVLIKVIRRKSGPMMSTYNYNTVARLRLQLPGGESAPFPQAMAYARNCLADGDRDTLTAGTTFEEFLFNSQHCIGESGTDGDRRWYEVKHSGSFVHIISFTVMHASK